MQQVLVAEAQTVERFVDLLKLEQTALRSGDTDALHDHAEQKLKFAAQLDELASERNAALASQGYDVGRVGVEAWCAKHPKEEIAAKAWATIIGQASQAREINRCNGELIGLRMQYNTKALEALRGSVNSLDLYGPDGQATTPGRQRISHSV